MIVVCSSSMYAQKHYRPYQTFKWTEIKIELLTPKADTLN